MAKTSIGDGREMGHSGGGYRIPIQRRHCGLRMVLRYWPWLIPKPWFIDLREKEARVVLLDAEIGELEKLIDLHKATVLKRFDDDAKKSIEELVKAFWRDITETHLKISWINLAQGSRARRRLRTTYVISYTRLSQKLTKSPTSCAL
jgi:hypothetical protein